MQNHNKSALFRIADPNALKSPVPHYLKSQQSTNQLEKFAAHDGLPNAVKQMMKTPPTKSVEEHMPLLQVPKNVINSLKKPKPKRVKQAPLTRQDAIPTLKQIASEPDVEVEKEVTPPVKPMEEVYVRWWIVPIQTKIGAYRIQVEGLLTTGYTWRTSPIVGFSNGCFVTQSGKRYAVTSDTFDEHRCERAGFSKAFCKRWKKAIPVNWREEAELATKRLLESSTPSDKVEEHIMSMDMAPGEEDEKWNIPDVVPPPAKRKTAKRGRGVKRQLQRPPEMVMEEKAPVYVEQSKLTKVPEKVLDKVATKPTETPSNQEKQETPPRKRSRSEQDTVRRSARKSLPPANFWENTSKRSESTIGLKLVWGKGAVVFKDA